MDPKSISQIINTLTEQSWLHGVKLGLAVLTCVFLYLEHQAHLLTEDARKRILKRIPLVLLGGGVVIAVLHFMAASSKSSASFQDWSVPLFFVYVAAVGLFTVGVHGTRFGVLHVQAKQIIGSVLAAIAIVFFFLFFQLSYKDYYHRWEFFHYYMGSKYTSELSYQRLYQCSAVADAETGNPQQIKRRKMRDLSATNLLVSSKPIVENPGICKDHFTPERWEAFKKDLVFFRKASGSTYWRDMQKDHGYNPPPIWTIAGHYLSQLQPASASYFKLLAGIDVVLTMLLFIAIGWAFGWRPFLVALVFWGTQEPAPFYWTGGAFLRQDWFFLAVTSACLARKKYFFLSGFALAYAAGLRIFPVLLWGGPLAIIAWDIYKKRRLQRMYLKFLLGGAAAVLILVPLSLHVTGGVHSYKEFAHHIKVHQNTALTNHVGLPTVIKATPEGRMKYARNNTLIDPFEGWKNMRHERYTKYKALWFGTVVGFGLLLMYTLRKTKQLWIGMALSLILVVSAVEATCYYWSIWVLAAIVTRVKRQMEWPMLAVFLGAIAFSFFKALHSVAHLNALFALVISLGTVGTLYYHYHRQLLQFARQPGTMEMAIVGLAGITELYSNQFYYIDDKFTAISAVYVAWTLAFVLAFFTKPSTQLVPQMLAARTESISETQA